MFNRFTVLLIAVFISLCFAAPVAAQYGEYPRVYLTDPVSCSDPQTEPLAVQDEYVISDEMTSQEYNQWVFVDSTAWNVAAIVYICPPADWSSVNVTINARHYSHGSYRNEHELNVIKGSFVEEFWENTYGGGCGGFTTTATDEVFTIPAVGDPAGSAPYQVIYSVRAYSKASCLAHAEHETTISFEGYETIKNDYCTDGIEVLESPVYMPSYSAWEATLVTGTIPFERSWVTYVYSDPSNDNAPIQVTGEFNGEQIHIREWGAYQELQDFSVPNRTDPYHQDPYGRGYTYDPDGFVTVPPANLRFATASELYLMSVCIQEAARPLTPSMLCPDGLEVLTEPLAAGDFAGLVYDDYVAVTNTTHIVVRYTLENPYHPADRGNIRLATDINDHYYLTTGAWQGRQMITATLPTYGAVHIPTTDVRLAVRNEGKQITIVSMCIIDALETMPQLREEECHLVNPDFVQGLGGWAVGGNVSWDGGAINGAATLEGGGLVWQEPKQATGTVWKMEIRARAADETTGLVQFGTSTANLAAGGAQIYTRTVTTWEQLSVDVFVEEPSPRRLSGGVVQVRGDNVQLDYVCLMTPDDALPIPECIEPEWDPSGSGDPLYTYLFKYLADWIMYGVCLLLRAISIAYNGIIRFLDNILLRIPNIENDDGLLGIADFINVLIFRMLDWLGASFADFFAWLGGVLADFGYFFWEIVRGFVAWLGDLLGFDPFYFLQELDALWDDTLAFWDEIQTELGLQSAAAMQLLQNMGNVMIVLINGVREGLTGETTAYIGTDFEGVGAFLWEGVNFVNAAVEGTPLTALNVIALAAITMTLMQWTLKKFTETLEFLS